MKSKKFKQNVFHVWTINSYQQRFLWFFFCGNNIDISINYRYETRFQQKTTLEYSL